MESRSIWASHSQLQQALAGCGLLQPPLASCGRLLAGYGQLLAGCGWPDGATADWEASELRRMALQGCGFPAVVKGHGTKAGLRHEQS